MTESNTADTLELTVILTAHNRADLIDDTLTSLAEQHWDGTWDILIVDNDSTDDTPEILQRWTDKMPVPTRILTATERHNPSYARNTAAANTTATNIAFIDDDDLIAPGWVAAIGTALRNHQLVGSRFDYHHLNAPELAGSESFQTDRLADGYGVATVSGGGMGIRRDVWNEVGGSDETLRFGEDIDFSLRVAGLGTAPAHFCADAVYHVRLNTGSGGSFARGVQIGRAAARLHKVYGKAIDSRPDSLGLMLRVWVAYLLRLPTIIDRNRRLVWAAQLGSRVGRLAGSVGQRTWYP